MSTSGNETSLPEPNVLFHQKKILVASKPGGLLTQGPPGIDSFELRIKRWLVSQRAVERKPYLGVPHRLDRPASGVMVFGLDKPAARSLAQQFENRKVDKTYWCIVEGLAQSDSGEWIDFMRKLPDEAKSEICLEENDGAQKAILNFKVHQRSDRFTLLEIRLETGRTHQIRLQTSSRGFPIVGDEMYGSQIQFGPETSDLRSRWIALHARRIQFHHPNKGENISIEAPLPEYWNEYFQIADDGSSSGEPSPPSSSGSVNVT